MVSSPVPVLLLLHIFWIHLLFCFRLAFLLSGAGLWGRDLACAVSISVLLVFAACFLPHTCVLLFLRLYWWTWARNMDLAEGCSVGIACGLHWLVGFGDESDCNFYF